VDEPDTDGLREGEEVRTPRPTVPHIAGDDVPMNERYGIRVLGRLGPALRAAFTAMHCEVVTHHTVIRGRMSGFELEHLLDRMDKSGIPLGDLYSTRP